MKSLPILVSILCAMSLVGCANKEVAQKTSTNGEVVKDAVKGLGEIRLANYDMGESVQVDNMTIIPLKEKPQRVQEPNQTPAPVVDYITLAEAKRQGVIEIKELDSPTVEILRVRNNGDKPILLVGGDLLLGGQQDRVVQEDTVIQPNSSSAVKVFCVEEGRWTGDSKFDSFGTVPYSVRKEATLNGGQSAVWSEVSGINASFGVDGHVTSVRAGLKAAEDTVGPSVQKFLGELKKQKGVVGVVFAVNGKVEAMDVFVDPKLFSASSEGLVRGYVTDAQARRKQVAEAPEDKEVANFVNRYSEMRAHARGRSADGNLAQRNADGLRLRELRETGAGASAPAIHGFMASD